MTEQLYDSISRLTAWVRDYGDEKQKPWIDDIRNVLEAAMEVTRLQAENARLSAIETAAREYWAAKQNYILPSMSDNDLSRYRHAEVALFALLERKAGA